MLIGINDIEESLYHIKMKKNYRKSKEIYN